MATGAFLNREDELGRLEEAWTRARAGEPQLAVVWGRRRVGKTFLLSHFARHKRAVFFGATEQSEAVELGRLLEALRRDQGERAGDLAGGGFTSWEAALRFFAALAADEALVVILDEVPYLTRSTRGFASVVQAWWDHLPPGTRLLLVLTGSAVGTVEGILGPGGPLRGRPTLSMRLDPLDPLAARAFLSRLDAVDAIEAYAACGGYPLHLTHWDQGATAGENLARLAGTTGGILLEDAQGILREELPERGGYPRILGAIGRGRTRLGQIATEAAQRVEHPLDVLIRGGFVRKVRPVGAPRRARPLYEIGDTYLRFFFAVLYSDLPEIESGQGRTVLRRRRPEWGRQLGWVFEEAARAHAVRMAARGELPDDLVMGRWWASTGEPCEVDVLGLRGSRTALMGEARWQAAPLRARDLHQLEAKLGRVPRPVEKPQFAMWGRGGVDAAVRRAGALGFDVDDVLMP